MTHFGILDELTDDQRRSLLSLAHRRKFRRHEAIFREGDPGDTVHLLDRGHVAVRVTTPAGDEATVRVLGPGDHFGELAVLDPSPRVATIVALGAVETLALHRNVVQQLRVDHRSVDRVLLTAAHREVRRLSLALSEAMYTPVPKRLARQLCNLVTLFDSDVLPVTQDDLAGLCGSTRQTTNQCLHDLQVAGIIALGRSKVTVLDNERLASAGR
jgi:CRP-like cAMP-binding protein